MRVLTADQMRDLDRRAIQECGIPGVVLMENAAAAVVAAVEAVCTGLHGKRVAIFCGSGNNGGDGYAVARRLMLCGSEATVFMMAPETQLKGDALVHYKALINSGSDIRAFTKSIDDAKVNNYDVVVDALLGTGLRDAPSERYAEAICTVNNLGRKLPVIAVDIPSGVNSDTGEVPGEVVAAKITVTFAYPKLGMFIFPGAAFVGELRVDNIGFDWNRIYIDGGSECKLTETGDFGSLFAARRPNSNKGDFGHVGIIAGSRGMTGAPTLVARSAQRVGAGLVTVFTSESAQPIVATKLDEQMTSPLPEVDGSVSTAAFEKIAAFAEKATVICVGPGLTTHPETIQLVHRLITELKVPIVLDADGLNALAKKPEIIEARRANTDEPLIITPHPGEAARLEGTSISEIESNRVASVRKLAKQYGAVALLKGRYTLISDPDGNVWINNTGNPGMASGGMGDTLSGIIAGLLAQVMPHAGKRDKVTGSQKNMAARIAAIAGSYLHGAAGDMAAEEHGEAGTTANDLINNLPAAMRAIRT